MEIVPALSFAPDEFVVIGIQVHVADGTFTVRRFAIITFRVAVLVFCYVGWDGRSVGEDLFELRTEKCQLVDKHFRGFQDIVQRVNLVFTFVSINGVWACA